MIDNARSEISKIPAGFERLAHGSTRHRGGSVVPDEWQGQMSAAKTPVRMGDVAELARRTDRLDSVEAKLATIDKKLDKLLELVLGLKPGMIARRS